MSDGFIEGLFWGGAIGALLGAVLILEILQGMGII